MAASTTSGNANHPAWLNDNHLFQAWLVLMLAIVFGTCLAAVHVNLSDKIAENKLNESLERIPGLIWQEGQGGASVEILSGKIAVKQNVGLLFQPTDGTHASSRL